ncbi:hypothetical protein AXF42_Ash002351 [Apostasia shenzhenica]|uniref:DUF4378 domain-containing protein n=1 Tax=Apostasia shenzhenica TaxID=1088818 RepID=A0A2I0ANA2_9ASPA|nr:hypothetical protein AXF42_Ash002351 [Apostasia shenzhenica]
MASSHGRRLFELLEEQQEPFLLEIYLLENGYSFKLHKSQPAIRCWPRNACRKLLGFGNNGVFKRRRWGMMPSLFLPKLLRWLPGLGGRRVVFSCFSGMDWRRMEDSKQLSPVSVLELHSDAMEESSDSEASLELLCSSCFSNLYQYKSCREGIREGLGEEDGGKAMKGQVSPLEKNSGEGARIAELIDVDLSGSRREWGGSFEAEEREIGIEIEGFIFEEMEEEVALEILRGCLL